MVSFFFDSSLSSSPPFNYFHTEIEGGIRKKRGFFSFPYSTTGEGEDSFQPLSSFDPPSLSKYVLALSSTTTLGWVGSIPLPKPSPFPLFLN